MILPALLLLGVAAAPPPTWTIGSPGLTYVDVPEKRGDFFLDSLAGELGKVPGVKVVTKSEIAALIGFERQKELLGCSTEASSCLAELSGALGAQYLITGSIAKLTEGYGINIKIVGTNDASTLAAFNGRADDDGELLDFMAASAKEVGRALRAKSGGTGAPPAVAVEQEVGSGGLRAKAWIPAAVGGVLLAAGGTSLFLAKGIESDLREGAGSSVTNVNDAVDRGQGFATVGYVLGGVGVAALATSGALYAFGAPAESSATLFPTNDGFVFAVGGRFP